MEQKKISFGFNKIIKKTNLLPNKPKEKTKTTVELLKCVEGQSIQILNQEQNVDEPLVIPLKESSRTSAALASLKLRQEVLTGDIEINDNQIVDKEKEKFVKKTEGVTQVDSIEQRAVRELLKQSRGESIEESTIENLTVPIQPEELPLDGAAEPTTEDYEQIPISQFGLAMLRGMGWKDEDKTASKNIEGPALRPKGMGLGADKVLSRKKLLIPPEANEKLEIKKNAYVRILGGKHKDLYGQIEALDDHAGRVFIKLALGGTRETLNEFMVQPVSKREYSEYAKVINTLKYEEYKKMENELGQIIIKKENIKEEKDILNRNEPRQNLSRSRRSSSNSDEEYKSSKRHYSKETTDYRQYTIKKEEREKIDNRSTHKSSKYSSIDAYDKRDKPRHISPENYKQNSSRDYHSSKYRDNSSESSSSSNAHKSKKKSKSKSKSKDKYYRRHRHNNSSDDDKRHKKKTKKSKRPRSRSRERR